MNKTTKSIHLAFLPIICALVLAISASLCFVGTNNAKAAGENYTIRIVFSGASGNFKYSGINEANANAVALFQLSNGVSKKVEYSGDTNPSNVSFTGLDAGEYTLTIITPTFTSITLEPDWANSPAITNNIIKINLTGNLDIGCGITFSQETWFTDTTVI